MRLTTLATLTALALTGCKRDVVASNLEPGARVVAASKGLVYVLVPVDGQGCDLSRFTIDTGARERLLRVRTCDPQDLAVDGPSFWRLGHDALVRHAPPDPAEVVTEASLLVAFALHQDTLFFATCDQDASCALSRTGTRWNGNSVPLQTAGITTVRRLATDGAALFWLDGGHRRNERSARTTPLLVRAPITPHAQEEVLDHDFAGDTFFLAGDQLYWHAGGALRRMPVTGGQPVDVLPLARLSAASAAGARLLVAGDGALFAIDAAGTRRLADLATSGLAADGDFVFFVDDATARLLKRPL